MKKHSSFSTNHRKAYRRLTWAFSPALALTISANAQLAGPSSSQTPYLLPSVTAPGVSITSILTVGDSVNNKPDGITPYRMVGIPDGLGAYDNGNGTFTVLMNHEISSGGVARDHGASGAFVSEWVIDKSSLKVLHGEDLMKGVSLWNTGTASYDAPALGVSFSRFCSADLAAPTAFFDPSSGLGTSARIFMNGEESGAEGRAMAHIASGADKGTSYQLANLGRFSWENAVANPYAQQKTLVMGTDDSTTDGGVYLYVGNKQATGNDVQRAGLTGGNLYGIKVNGTPAESRAAGVNGTFSLYNHGDVSAKTGAALNTESAANGVTGFLRPEDGSWDPQNPNDFYFVTTDRFDQVKDGTGTQVGRSRLYKLHFADLANPENGGTITTVLDGTTQGNMFDNITVKNGKIILCEDVGNVSHNGKVLEFDIATGALREIAHHDVARFGDLTVAATAPFTVDEESSGVIDISDILGGDQKTYLIDTQAHYSIAGELVEGGQLMAMFVPVPEASTFIPGLGLAGLVGVTTFLRRRTMKNA